jgi:branched-chain amino acid transport system permease protein
LQLPLSLLGVTALQAMGLQVILGGGGMLTLGHTAFFAIGGYASAAFVTLVAPRLGIESTVPLFICGASFAVFCSSAAAILVSIPCLRLRGDYLAVATMGLGQITENILTNIPEFGGASGFTHIPHLASLGLIWFCVVFIAFALQSFYQTGVGQAIVCSRDDEVVARCFGISTVRSKFIAFLVGNMITGLAGALYVHALQFISPTAAGFQKSVEILLAVVIGGMFSIWGAILGAALLVMVPELLRFIPSLPASSISTGSFGHLVSGVIQNSMLIFSLLVLIILKVNPAGLTIGFKYLKRNKNAAYL